MPPSDAVLAMTIVMLYPLYEYRCHKDNERLQIKRIILYRDSCSYFQLSCRLIERVNQLKKTQSTSKNARKNTF